jgi:transposase-like protein
MTMNVNLSFQLEAMVKAKLQQLRSEIEEGLGSGEPTPWNADEIKREGRKKRASGALPLRTPRTRRRSFSSRAPGRFSLKSGSA